MATATAETQTQSLLKFVTQDLAFKLLTAEEAHIREFEGFLAEFGE